MNIVFITELFWGLDEKFEQELGTGTAAVFDLVKYWSQTDHVVCIREITISRRKWIKSILNTICGKRNIYREVPRHYKAMGIEVFTEVYPYFPHNTIISKIITGFLAQRARKILATLSWEPDVIISEMPTFSIMYYIKKIRKDILKIGLLHRGDLDNLQGSDSQAAYRRQLLSLNFDRIISRSEAIYQCAKQLGIQNLTDEVIGFGIPVENNDVQRNWKKLSERKITVLYAGRLMEQKGIQQVLKCLPLLSQYNIEFVILGSGDYEVELKKLVNNLSIQEQVFFIERKSRQEVYEYMKKADIFIMPSYHETFGLVYPEAMSCGCITIGSKGEGIDGIIQDGENGYLVDPHNMNEIKQLLEKIVCSDEEQLDEMSRAAIATANEFSEKHLSDKYHKLIEKYMSEKKKMLVVSHAFTPESNGTISCLENILPVLSKQYDITLICAKGTLDAKPTETRFGAKIIRLYKLIDYCLILKHKLLMDIWRSSAIKHKTFSVTMVKAIFHVPMRISKRYGFFTDKSWAKNFICKKTSKYIDDADIVMAIGASFDDVRVAYQIKKEHPEKYLILIFFDLFAFNPVHLNHDHTEEHFQERLQEELKWYDAADQIIVQKEMFETLMHSEFAEFLDKITIGFIPSIDFDKYFAERELKYSIAKNKPEDEIRIVYSGSFYEDIRNPRVTLELLSRVCKQNPSIIVHIVGYGCEDILNEYKTKMGKNLVLHGWLCKEAADDMVYSANILLNISNKCKTQVPSKFMEYLGSGKPIVNVYSIDEDIGEQYLKDYLLHFSIDERKDLTPEMIRKTLEFICEKQNEVSIEVKEQYAQWSAEKFASLITLQNR